MNRIERWIKDKYNPTPAPWKRPILATISILILFACLTASYYQIELHWTNNGIWYVIGLFVPISLISLLISIFGNDFWVAAILGKPNI
jgi:hypothetical protein